VRQEGESITAYVTRLRDLASHCEYGDSAKELIRDRLVCGVRDDTLQRTLLAVAKLTFDKAFELALLHESAVQNARLLRDSSSAKTVHYADPAGPPKDPSPGKPCFRCGGRHHAKDCRFKNAKCNYCHKKGHIQRACLSRLRQQQSRSPQALPEKPKQRQTHRLEEGDEPPSRSSTTVDPVTPQAPPVEPLPVNYDLFTVGTDKKVDPYLLCQM